MAREYPQLLDLVGGTPIVRLDKIGKDIEPTLLAKLEHLNPGGSAKDLGFTPAGFVSGYQDAFWALIALALIGAVAAFILLRGVRREDVVEQEPAEVAV